MYWLQRPHLPHSMLPVSASLGSCGPRTTTGAYNLIRMKEGDKWKMAFHITRGHYKYLVIPYGLSNAPAIFQAFINEIFRDFLNHYVIFYVDDTLIYSAILNDHVHLVHTVLSRLLQHKLYVKAENCEFHMDSITFLGYVRGSRNGLE